MILVTFTPMSEKSKINLNIFLRLIAYARPYKKLLFFAFVCTISLTFLASTRPYLIGEMVDQFIVGEASQTKLFLMAMVILSMLAGEALFQFGNSYLSNLLAQSVVKDLRVQVFNKITSFRMRYFDQTPIGALVTRVVSDIEAISEVFSAGLVDILGDLLTLFAVIGIMLYVNWKLTLLVLIPIPLLLIATKVFAKAMQKSFKQERLQVTRLNTFVQERLTGMSVVQLFNRQKEEFESFEEINKGHRQAHINAVWAYSIFFPVVEILSALSIAFLLVYIAFQISDVAPEEVQERYKQIFSFTLWINMLFRPIRQLADKFNILQRGVVRAERVFEVVDLKENLEQNQEQKVCDFNQPLVFDQVCFSYILNEPVLKNISLTIKPNSVVAFVGATGAGKSSIVNLLSRFYEFETGNIFIGDTNIRDVELNFLRKNISVVLQDVFLFSDTIHNNITLNNPKISREAVIEAAKIVGAHDFIISLPGDYDYEVGERGGSLSMGQRQLLAFIRAYVYNPTILILDEATSSIDNESEELIQKATEKLTKGRTSIVIAHRLSTIQRADMIVVLDKGEIIEQGTHNELIKIEGYYKRLYDRQFSE
jgi:ATP-binding cassette, subfamily B, multidrug efflux pump